MKKKGTKKMKILIPLSREAQLLRLHLSSSILTIHLLSINEEIEKSTPITRYKKYILINSDVK